MQCELLRPGLTPASSVRSLLHMTEHRSRPKLTEGQSALIKDAVGSFNAILEGSPALRERPGQKEMVHAVASTFALAKPAKNSKNTQVSVPSLPTYGHWSPKSAACAAAFTAA